MDTLIKPTSNRRKLTAVAVAVMVVSLLAGCLNANQRTVAELVTSSRATAGLPKLLTQNDAQRKAQAWAEKMARENKLYHSNLRDGMGGVKWCQLGENVGYGPSIQSVHTAYMKSPGHKANIMSNAWNGIGVGYAESNHGGVKRIWTVHVFVKTC